MKNKKYVLILNIPVIHKGFLDFLEKYKYEDQIDCIYIIGSDLIDELSEFKPDINSLSPSTIVRILTRLGYKRVWILEKNRLEESLNLDNLLLINDEISRNLYEKYLKNKDVKWKNMFLYWDREKVFAEHSVDVKISNDRFNINIMKKAYQEAKKSFDCWRQVGAVCVKDKKIILKGYNIGIPDDYNLVTLSNKRNFLKVGERPDLSPTLHAEKSIIVQAARIKDITIEKADIYITHFPCEDCARLIAYSKFNRCYFSEGSSNLDGLRVLEASEVKIINVHV